MRDGCDCRKPKPGLLLDAAPRDDDLAASFMVGDRWRDIEAGRRAGCRATILVDYGYDERHPDEPDRACRGRWPRPPTGSSSNRVT